jgi:hypothetical protein
MHPPRKANVPTTDKRPCGRPFSCNLGNAPIRNGYQELRLKLRSKSRPWRWISAVRAFWLALGFQLVRRGSFPLAEHSSASQSSSRLHIVVEGVNH